MQRKHIALILHGARAGREDVRHLVNWVREKGHYVEPMVTFEAGEATAFTADAARRGVDVIAAAGGDGTINECVNGLDGFDTVLKFNSPLHIKHLQNLIDLQKDKTYDYSGRANASESRFGSGECPIFLTSSGYYATAKGTAKFAFTSAPMPYYPDVAGAPQNSIIGGASLWVMGGKKPEEYKGVAKFFAFLSDTNRQAKLHQESGYLPITRAAYEKTKADGFYEKNPVLETPLKELTNKEPTENSRGLRFGNMVQMRDVWAEEIEAALAGKKTAQQALDDAVAKGNAMLRTFEKTAK